MRGLGKRMGAWSREHVGFVALATLALALGVCQVAGEDPIASVVASAGAVALVFLGLGSTGCLCDNCSSLGLGDAGGRFLGIAALVLVGAAAADVVVMPMLADSAEAASASVRLSGARFADGAWVALWVVLTCALTAAWEEGLFRGLLHAAVLRQLDASQSARLVAAATCSLVFALAHLGGAASGVSSELGIEADQGFLLAAARFVQVWCFGMAMAGARECGAGLAGVIAIHALYDTVLFLPIALGASRVGAPVDAGALLGVATSPVGIAVTLLTLVPAALWAMRALLGRAAGPRD